MKHTFCQKCFFSESDLSIEQTPSMVPFSHGFYKISASLSVFIFNRNDSDRCIPFLEVMNKLWMLIECLLPFQQH